MGCEGCSFPSLPGQIKNVTLSVMGAINHAFKTGQVLASKEEITNRVSTCEACDLLVENRCSACGCYVALKAGLMSEKCPKGRW